MQAAVRSYVMAGAALAATSVMVVTPVAPRPIEIPIRSIETRLVDADSILNIPLNLFYDFMNVPYNEVQAVDALSTSLFFSGPWDAVSATNLLGIDPGDPGHFEAVAEMLVPFPALSGAGQGEFDWEAGLAQQLAGFVAAEAPVSASCDAEACAPIFPTSPITGSTDIDLILWLEQIATGQEQFPLVNNWFQIPLSTLVNGYSFNSAYPGYVDPSGPANSMWGLAGTQTVDGQNLMPWDNTTYQLNPLPAFENFFQSLMAPPSTDGIVGASGIAIPGTGIELPTFTELGQALQALMASLVLVLDPFTPGSGLCPGDCSFANDLGLNYPQLIQDISNLMPGNPIIEQWQTAMQDGTANVPTAIQIQDAINDIQQGDWDFGNPPLPTGWSVGLVDPNTLAPFYEQLWTDLGLQPGQGTAAAAVDSLDSTTLLSGLDPSALSTDLTTLLSSLLSLF